MRKISILECLHFILLEFSIYFTFESEKIRGCVLVVLLTFGISFFGSLFKKRYGYLLVGVLGEISVLLLAENIVELIMFTSFVIILTISYIISSGEKKASLMKISPVWLIIILICYIPLYFTGYRGGVVLQVLGGTYLLLYLVYMAEQNMEDFKMLHSRMAKLPLVQLTKGHIMSVTAVVLWVAFGLFLGRNERFASYLTGKIKGLLAKMEGSPVKIAPEGMSGGAMNLMESYGIREQEGTQQLSGKYSEMNDIVQHILELFLCIIVFAFVLFLVYSIYCYLKRDKKDEGDIVEFIKAAEKREKLIFENTGEERKKEKNNSPNAIIRRLYKRKIKEGIQGKIPLWASPTELEMMAEWQETGSGSELHLLYEKARYSKEGCLKEDLDRYNLMDKR
ncbi:MAG: hypothetical protein IJA36_05215 [Lachnospiraceae bacterium]|nr:hypothetical protein [Lachnospiraceae bacterium]